MIFTLVCNTKKIGNLRFAGWYFPVAAIFLTGCATNLAHHDASTLRDMTIDYYQDQIIDNLVRAKNGQPFLHVNISSLNAQITSKLTGSINGGQSLANTGSHQKTTTGSAIPTVVSTIASVATRPFNFTISPERDDQITVNTSPQYGDPFIYDMYLRYLSLRKPGHLIMNKNVNDKSGSDTIPNITSSENIISVREKLPGEILVEGGSVSDDDLHYVPGTLHRWHGNEYYIPIAFKQPYFDLCVALLGRIVTADVGSTVASSGTATTSKGPSTKVEHVPTRRKLYIAPPDSESPTSRALRDIKSQIEMLPQY